ncbi:hypothetical protein AALP_AA4G270800 [Arabis alpina]|uniref:NAB domain-containing protein n=1 Tax=Arabis alpina TaxID=50452 RepID=A0A087H5Z3_ARAAL|nr:hypothetical protein AALP_AA4G270800 [Arabis alpina]
MLKLIEGNADSFAQRAETYYKKRPELITIVEDFYRAHRSLAERFDHLKSSSSDNGLRSSKFHHQETMESVCDSNSQFEDADSEIEDPVYEEEDQNASSSDDSPPFEDKEEAIEKDLEVVNCKEDQTLKLEQEKLKLIEETDALRKQLLEKDEEKREVIRQLSLTIETLKEENLKLKRRLDVESIKKRSSRSVFEFEHIHKLFYIMWEGGKKKV